MDDYASHLAVPSYAAPDAARLSVMDTPGVLTRLSHDVNCAAAHQDAAFRHPLANRDFSIIRELGNGSFGTVCVAEWRSALPSGTMVPAMQHSYTRPEYIGKCLVAIKRMNRRFYSWDDCMRLNELRALIALPAHDHIIPLYDIFLPQESQKLHIVFECMEGNLYQLIRSRRGSLLANGLLCSIIHQTLLGLEHIHSHGFFHRDLKPENLLITTTGLAEYPRFYGPLHTAIQHDVLVLLKIADFGLAREIASPAPYSEYVSTRWYRAPEVLLRAPKYGPPMDMWALGTIMAELINFQSLFPGASETDMLLRIVRTLGSPRPFDLSSGIRVGGGPWPEGHALAHRLGIAFPDIPPGSLANCFAPATLPRAIDLMQRMMLYDPNIRISAREALDHSFITTDAKICQPIRKVVPPRINVPPATDSPRTPSTPAAPRAEPPPATSPTWSLLSAQNSPPTDANPPPERNIGRFLERAVMHGMNLHFLSRRRSAQARYGDTGGTADLRPVNSEPNTPTTLGPSAAAHAFSPHSTTPPAMSRKEARRVAKEHELARREADHIAMRSRARAVIQKHMQIEAEHPGSASSWQTLGH